MYAIKSNSSIVMRFEEGFDGVDGVDGEKAGKSDFMT